MCTVTIHCIPICTMRILYIRLFICFCLFVFVYLLFYQPPSAINSCPGSPGHGPDRQRLPSFEVISQYASKLLQESSSSDGDGDGEGEGEDDEKENGELEIQETDGRNHNNDDGDAEEEFPTPSSSPSRNEPSEDKSEENHQKPLYSYAQLIVQALLGSKDRKQTLSGIYKFISTNYPYYKITDKGWKVGCMCTHVS